MEPRRNNDRAPLYDRVASCYFPSMPPRSDLPTYDLADFKRLIESGPESYRIELTASNHAGSLDLEESDIIACVLALDVRPMTSGGDFYKTMPSKTRPGMFHDVYRPSFYGLAIYCKIQLMTTRLGGKAVVIQFKRDTSR